MPRYQNRQPIDPELQDLQQLLQLAQLQQLLSGPQIEQQTLGQREQQARLHAAIQLMGLEQEREKDEAALAEATRYHTADLAHKDAAVKSGVAESLVNHLSQRTDIPLTVLADTLAESGHTGLSTALRTAHESEVQKRAATHLATINTLRTKGDKNALSTYLPTVQADPDVWNRIKDQIPADAVEPQSTGVSTNTPGYMPELAAGARQGFKYLPITTANLGALMYNKAMVPPLNLLNSLVGAPPLQTEEMMPLDYEALAKNFFKPRQ